MAIPRTAAARAVENVSIETLDEIYELRQPTERTFHTTLKPHEQHLFQLFATGYKLRSQQLSKTIPTQNEIIEGWRNTDEIDRELYLLTAEQRPDPRLNPSNFQVDAGVLQLFMAELPEPDQPTFAAFVYGCKARDSRYGQPNWHQAIIKAWSRPDTTDRDQFVAYGRELHNRFLAQLPPRQPASGQGGHWWVEPKPDAQMSDIKLVNLVDPKPPGAPPRPAGSRWVFEKTIYQNSNYKIAPGLSTQRIVHLFALVNKDLLILKRMVVKIMGAPTYDKIVRDVDSEYLFQRDLSFRGCPSILDAYGKSIRKRAYLPHLGYIYMDYAAFGDLQDVIDELERQPNKQLPEPYLWLIFRGLAEAILLMETGITMGKNEPAFEDARIQRNPRWRLVTNLDIKPPNVMFSEAQNDYYPGYKTAKMIDFGICFDDNRYTTWQTKGEGIGTPGYCPPEQAYPSDPEYMDYPINLYSEIFNIGLIMLNLMEGCTRTLGQQELEDRGFWHTTRYDKCYSSALDDLVFHCLRFAPEARTGLNQLLYRTRIGLAQWEKVYGSANKPEAELPDFATYQIAQKDGFLIGQEAPDHWKGMRARKKRTSEDAGFAQTGTVAQKRRDEHPPPLPPPDRIQMDNGAVQPPVGPLNRYPGIGRLPNIPPEGPPVGHPKIGRGNLPPPLPPPPLAHVLAVPNHAQPLQPQPLNLDQQRAAALTRLRQAQQGDIPQPPGVFNNRLRQPPVPQPIITPARQPGPATLIRHARIREWGERRRGRGRQDGTVIPESNPGVTDKAEQQQAVNGLTKENKRT